ncbi:ABC transporter substrate-binding protein [[Mycobacterium] burgundiense]|uniref:ABC transporter substrate-binding protein n=1 Tax=[Mycobacterium] burgundiense TaxID=3064286 RepID=A0ABM9LXM0_9MYCO|nr:ABC transporter substrate-binding protein [Mycolicibacterium sp. MU0053]CAJ1506431.1 ABC transporter substrate-binding protein [Mycolicibacterium sp. MU0053]
MRARTIVTLAAIGALLTGCAGATEPPPDQIVLAEGQELGGFNPVSGYGEQGVSPLYDGLLRPAADGDALIPELVPALAEGAPESVGPRRWRLPLRTDVTFSDGSTFDSADVVATYGALKDPVVASEISTNVDAIADVAADGPDAVIVTMRTDANPEPYLLAGIVPAERVEAKPAADWALNTAPVGTGPYVLESLRPDQAVMVARDDYWGERAQVARIVYTHTPDDNVRAQRLSTGEVDGVSLPPRLIDSLQGDDITTVAVKSADWRGVSFPAGNAFTADPQARLAMNRGIDRHALIRDVLSGYGRPAHTPVADVYGAAYNPQAVFAFDPAAATGLLDAAGWRPGPGGVREKDGARAEFELLYNAADTVRRDLAVAFAAAVKPLGIAVRTRGTSWDEIDTSFERSAVLLGGGSTPYSIDAQVYDTLHTRLPNSSPYANPGNFTSPGLDELLDEARQLPDGAAKDELYRQVQASYLSRPSNVFLAFLDHTYGYRESGWNQSAPILEPHSHGVAWGPWWRLNAWTR